MESLSFSLQITLIGMGLVFASLILLWGLMEWLVRLTPDQPEVEESLAVDPVARIGEAEFVRKQQAAAIAVAIALAEQMSGPREFPLPPTALVSAWQAVMRTDMLKKRGQVR
jgi:Na+-transporting methylmalonyl-CoA/oxaloacetate decarboxylase gamma subunit